MGVNKEFKSKVSLSISFKLLNSQLKFKSCSKVGFFSNTLNSKLCVRNFSTVINLPKLYEQKEKTLLFFLDNLWDAEEVLRSRYCLIMILSFKKYLDNTVHSSPMKSRMDLNIVRKYIKLVLVYLKNSLVSDIDRINSKFLIFFYFLTKTANFLTKSNFLSTRKRILRNLFFIFVFSRGRARYFANLTATNNVISKSYASFVPKIKYASSVFPTGLFLVLYSPYKSSFSLGFTSRLISKHKQFLKKLAYIHKLLNIYKLKRSGSVEQTFLGFRKNFSKTGLGFSIFRKNSFLFESRILRSKIIKKFKFLKTINFRSSAFVRKKASSAHILSTKSSKKSSSNSLSFFKFNARTKLFFRRTFSKFFFLPSVSKFVKRLLIGLISKLRFLVASIRFRIGNKTPRGRATKLLKIFTRRRIWLRQLYKFFSYSFIRTSKQLFNSTNKILVLANSFINFKKFGKNVLFFCNFYRSQYHMSKKFKYFFSNKVNQHKIFNNVKIKKKRLIGVSMSSQNFLISSKVFALKKTNVKQINFLLGLHSSFFFFSNKNFLNLKKTNVPFIANVLFNNLRNLIFSKLFNFRKFSDIFFFYLNLVKLIKTSLKFNVLRGLLIYFPFFFHYGSQFVSNSKFFLNKLTQNSVVLLDQLILGYKNSFNTFIKFRLFKLEQLHLDRIGNSSKSLLKKKLSRFKYLKKTPVQTFIVERQNLRNLEFMTGKVKKLVMKFKYFTRRKNDAFFSAKLKRKVMLAKKRSDRLLLIKKNRIKKKKNVSSTSKVLNSSLFKYFKTKKFKKRYAMYKLAKKRIVKRWKRRDSFAKRSKHSKVGFFAEEFFSTDYIHRFHFRKRLSRVDYRRLKRKFFVNFLFFMRTVKQKRIAYNYYKIGKKSFKLAALQKISNPFFLRLKLKRYLVSEKHKRMINRFSFLNSSYGLKSCITKFCSFMSFDYANFFDSYLDKYKAVKFSFSKTYKSFFYPLVFLFKFDSVYNWLVHLKNFYFFYKSNLLELKFFNYLLDYSFLLKFFFRKSGCFIFPKKLLIFLLELKTLAIFLCKIKNFSCSFFLVFLKAFFWQNSIFKIRHYRLSYCSKKRFYSTCKFLIFRKNKPSYQNIAVKNTLLKLRFYFIPLFKKFFFMQSFICLNSNMLFARQLVFSPFYDFISFSKIYSIPCFNFKKKEFSDLNYCFQFNFLKLHLDFFPNIFLFFKNSEKNVLNFFNNVVVNSNSMFFGIGFFSFLYSILRGARFSFQRKFTSFFRPLPKPKKRKIIIQSPHYKRKKNINKYERFLSGLVHLSRRPRSLKQKRRKKFRRLRSILYFQSYRKLEINSKWHKLFKKYMLSRVKERRKSKKMAKFLRKPFLSKKPNFKVSRKPLQQKPFHKKPFFVHKFKFQPKLKRSGPKVRYTKFLSYDFQSHLLEEEKRTYGLRDSVFNLKFYPHFNRNEKLRKKLLVPKITSKSVFLSNQLLMPSILKGTLLTPKIRRIFENTKIYPFKRIFFLKKYFSDFGELRGKFFSNSKTFIFKLFNVDFKYFNSFYNFSLSKIKFFFINLKTQRFLRLLLLASYQFQYNYKYLFKSQTHVLHKILYLENFLEHLFILDFFELSCLNFEFDFVDSGSDLTILALLENFICVFYTFFSQNNINVILYYFYNFFLLNLNYVVFSINCLKNSIDCDANFFEFATGITFFLKNVNSFYLSRSKLKKLRRMYSDLVNVKMKSKLLTYNSFSEIVSSVKLFIYLVNYSKLRNRYVNSIPLKFISCNFSKHFIYLLYRLHFVELKFVKRSKRSKIRIKSKFKLKSRFRFNRFLVFKNSFFFFMHSLFVLLLEKFSNICEKLPVNFSNNFISFVVNLFFKNLNLFTSNNTVFKGVLNNLFRKTLFRNFDSFTLQFKLRFLRILVSNNQKFLELFNKSSFESRQLFFPPLNIEVSPLHLMLSENLKASEILKVSQNPRVSRYKYKHSALQSKFQIKNKFEQKSDLVKPISLQSSGMFFLISTGLLSKLNFLKFKKFRKWNKHIKRKFFTKFYFSRRSKRFLGRRFRRRLKKYFFSEFYCQTFEKHETLNSQLSHLLLLRKAANLKLFSRYKIIAKTPKKNSFSLLLKNELEPKYARTLRTLTPNRASFVRRRLIVKKRFHPFLKRKIIVGFLLSPRFLNFKNFSNSGFFMKVNFDSKVKNKLSLFLRLNRFMEFIFKVILRVKLYLKKKVFVSSNLVNSNFIIGRFFSDNFYFYIVKIYRKLKLLTISFFNKLSIYFNKIRGFDDRLIKKFNFTFNNLKFLFFYNFLSSKFLRIFVLRYFFFGYYIKYRFQFINRLLWFRVLPLNSFLLTPKVFIIVTQVKNNFFITGTDLYGRILYKTSPGVMNFTGSDRVSKYAWFAASVDFFDGFLEFFRYFLRSRKRKKISYTSLRISREVNINFNKRKKKFGAFLHPVHYIFAAKRKLKKKKKKRRLKSKVILRRFFVISKGVSDFHLRIFVKGMLNERYYVSKYFAGAVNYPMRSFSLCRIKKVRRI